MSERRTKFTQKTKPRVVPEQETIGPNETRFSMPRGTVVVDIDGPGVDTNAKEIYHAPMQLPRNNAVSTEQLAHEIAESQMKSIHADAETARKFEGGLIHKGGKNDRLGEAQKAIKELETKKMNDPSGWDGDDQAKLDREYLVIEEVYGLRPTNGQNADGTMADSTPGVSGFTPINGGRDSLLYQGFLIQAKEDIRQRQDMAKEMLAVIATDHPEALGLSYAEAKKLLGEAKWKAIQEKALKRYRDKYKDTMFNETVSSKYWADDFIDSVYDRQIMAGAGADVASAIAIREDDDFSMVSDNGSWLGASLFDEQLWMIKHYLLRRIQGFALIDQPYAAFTTHEAEALTSKTAPKEVKFLFGQSFEDCRLFESNLLFRTVLSSYSFLPPSLHALLVPRIRLYLQMNESKSKQLLFDEHLDQQQMAKLASGELVNLPGVGLLSVDIEDKASNGAEIRKNYALRLKVYSTNAQTFASKRTGRGGVFAGFQELWYNVNQRDKKGLPNNKLIADLGWNIPEKHAIIAATNCTPKQAEAIRHSLSTNNLKFRLYLRKYDLAFQQDGSVEFEGEYQAATSSNFFERDVFPIDRGDPGNPASEPYIRFNEHTYVAGHRTGAIHRFTIREALEMIKTLQDRQKDIQQELTDAQGNRSGGSKPTTQENEARSQLRRVRNDIAYLKNEVTAIRFTSSMDYLSQNNKIQGIILEDPTDIKSSNFSAKKIKAINNTGKDSFIDAAAKAVKNSRSREVPGVERIFQTNYHNLSNEGTGHKIAYVHFYDIIDSIVHTIKTTSSAKNQKNLKKFQIHLGKAELYADKKLYWVNIGLIPITIPRYIQFMQNIYSSIPHDDKPYPVDMFLDKAVKYLIMDVINSYRFRITNKKISSASRNNETRPEHDHRHVLRARSWTVESKTLKKNTTTLNQSKRVIALGGSKKQDGWRTMTPPGNTTTRSTVGTTWSSISDPSKVSDYYDNLPEYGPDCSAKSLSFYSYSNMIRNFDPTLKPEELHDIFYLGIDSLRPTQFAGRFAENMANGIYHFYIGSDKGILKNISFQQQDISGRQEAIMLSSGKHRQILHFDATVRLMGNSIFSNGDLIYISPYFRHGQDIRVSTPETVSMGIGGYYYVNKVNHYISRDGFETELSCKYSMVQPEVMDDFGGTLPERHYIKITSALQYEEANDRIARPSVEIHSFDMYMDRY